MLGSSICVVSFLLGILFFSLGISVLLRRSGLRLLVLLVSGVLGIPYRFFLVRVLVVLVLFVLNLFLSL